MVLYISVAILENNFLERFRVRPEYLLSIWGKLFGGLALFDASSYLDIALNGYIKGGISTYFSAYTASWPDRHFTANFLHPVIQLISELLIFHTNIRPNDWLGLSSFFFASLTITLAIKYKLRVSYIMFAVLNLCLPLFSDSLDSLGRYYMIIFTLIISLALFFDDKPRLFSYAIISSAVVSLSLMSAFMAGIFVG